MVSDLGDTFFCSSGGGSVCSCMMTTPVLPVGSQIIELAGSVRTSGSIEQQGFKRLVVCCPVIVTIIYNSIRRSLL